MTIIVFLSITVLCIVISLVRSRHELSRGKVVETILLYMFFINVGLSGLLAFYGHAFLSDKVAVSIGWPTGNPFQLEVAVTNLAFGVLGILCFFFRDGFWLATGIGYSTFLFGAAYIHIQEILFKQNYAVNNAGPILYIGDIFIPSLILVLLFLRWKLR